MGPLLTQISHIHRALGGEMLKVEAQAAALDAAQPGSVAALAGHLAMVRATLDVHAAEEDHNIFPMIEGRLPGITASYDLDHKHERGLFAEIDADLASLQSAGATDTDMTARRLYRNIVAVTSHLTNHMEKEEQHLYSSFTSLLNEEQELEFVARALNGIPEQALPMAMPWQAGFLTDDEVLGNIDLFMRILSPEKQRAFIVPLAKGLPAERWQGLVQRRPELSAFES